MDSALLVCKKILPDFKMR
uniref:Uncharacterized protein n=1 Tax=Anguilla anguilla TaxID=7936 RepID=A0A0E9V485_ANGAN